MRILRWMTVLLLFILAVLLARENDALVDLVYQPGVPFHGLEEPRSVRIPLFLLVLITLGVGGILGGGMALFQQTSLKLRLRRSEKDNGRLTNDVAAVREKLGLVAAQLDQARRETAELRGALGESGEDSATEPHEEGVPLVVEAPVTGASHGRDYRDDGDHELERSKRRFDPAAGESEISDETAAADEGERTEESR